jgi:hypothetical protein
MINILDAAITEAQDRAREAQRAALGSSSLILREARDRAEDEFHALLTCAGYTFPHTDADDNDVMVWDYHMRGVWSFTINDAQAYVSWNGSGLWSYVIIDISAPGTLMRDEIMEIGERVGDGLLPSWARGPLGIIAYKAADHDMSIAQANEGEPYEDYDAVDVSYDYDDYDLPDTGYYGY